MSDIRTDVSDILPGQDRIGFCPLRFRLQTIAKWEKTNVKMMIKLWVDRLVRHGWVKYKTGPIVPMFGFFLMMSLETPF